MPILKQHGKSPGAGRELISLRLKDLGDLPATLSLPTPNFIALIVMDADGVPVDGLFDFGTALLGRGAVFLCTWGPDCERVHDILDEAEFALQEEGTDETVVMTTWHDSESLAEALWFAINTAFPAAAYEANCNTVLVITIGNPVWSDEVDKWLSAPDQLSNTVLQEDAVRDGA